MGRRGRAPGGRRAEVPGSRSRGAGGQCPAVAVGPPAREEGQEKEEMSGPTPRRLLYFVTRCLRLRRYLRDPGDGRPQPQIPTQLLLWALLVGQILRQHSFHAVEALVRSAARRSLSLATSFSDDTLGYFTERLDPEPTPQALLSI